MNHSHHPQAIQTSLITTWFQDDARLLYTFQPVNKDMIYDVWVYLTLNGTTTAFEKDLEANIKNLSEKQSSHIQVWQHYVGMVNV